MQLPQLPAIELDAQSRAVRNLQAAILKLELAAYNQMEGPVFKIDKDPRITNQWEKASVVTSALNYAGTNPQANEMFKDVMSKEENGFGRFGAVLALAGGNFGPIQRESPSDPNVIRARMTLLNSVTVTDERLSGIVESTKKNLQNLLDGKPVENAFGGFGRPRGGPPGN